MPDALESILKRDRRLTFAGLALVVLLAWAYVLAGAGMGMGGIEMTRMSSDHHMHMNMQSAMTVPAEWTAGYAVLVFFMWWIMMAAMMLPAAAPVILLAAAVNRKAAPDRAPYASAGWFTLGYLIGWASFSMAAVAVQWGLADHGLLSPMLKSTSPSLAGGLLAAAGLWQFTPLKRACLKHCRSPLDFLTRHRHNGNIGGTLTGIRHGAYCLGCCWFLMALLFVGGVMNLFWIAALAIYVWMEKALPRGDGIRRITGAGLLIWGLAVIMGAE